VNQVETALSATGRDGPPAGPVDSLRLGVRARQESPLNDRVWRLALYAGAATVVLFAVDRLTGSWNAARGWLLALVAVPGWAMAARMLLLDSSWRRFWAAGLIAVFALTPLAGDSPLGVTMSLSFGIVFLLVRRYRPYRHLSSWRRAKLFGLSVVCLGLLLGLGDRPDPTGWLHGGVANTANAATYLLGMFWALTALRLFFGMRLNFMRLKPKLAVAGLFIALVPLTLAIVLALVAAYGALGGARASQAKALLLDWVQMVERGVAPPVFEHSQTWTPDQADPAWMAQYVATADSLDQARIVVADGAFWVVDRSPGASSLMAWAIDDSVVRHLSRLVQCDVGLFASDRVQVSSNEGIVIRAGEEGSEFDVAVEGTTASPDSSWWRRSMHFGGATLSTWRMQDGELQSHQALLGLKVSLQTLLSQYVSEDNQINQAIVLALAVIAGLFLLVEVVALFFGFRITGGITSAVKILHQGTERLARGDLDTYLEVPNEDELGDLAASFNEMTAAVKVGQEQALLKERLEQEVLMARQIQERLLPRRMPERPAIEVAGGSVPSRQVGGDYFDFLPLSDGSLGIAVGDVTGKGVPAALLMATLQACLHGQVIHPGSVASVVSRVNDLMAEATDPHMFATFIYGVLAFDGAEFTACNAGHEPPILRRADGSVERLTAGGLVLGMLPDQNYTQSQVALRPGDVLVLYTDGITEAMGPVAPESTDGASDDAEEDEADDTNFFGEQRLVDLVHETAGLSAERIRQRILDAVSVHTQGIPQSDDITLVVVKKG
jgi:serine phosphatase RsbU (regulator of sigma subunit)